MVDAITLWIESLEGHLGLLSPTQWLIVTVVLLALNSVFVIVIFHLRATKAAMRIECDQRVRLISDQWERAMLQQLQQKNHDSKDGQETAEASNGSPSPKRGRR